MSDQTPSPIQKTSMTLPWLAWILAATLMPVLSFLILGKDANEQAGGIAMILLAIVAQLACSIWLSIMITTKRSKGAGFGISLAIALIIASVAIGTAMFFTTCLASGFNLG